MLATKFGMDMNGANGADRGVRGSRRYVRRAVEASLRRLRTDHIDLYQLHRPDDVTPIEETLSVLTDLVREGKVRYLGSSNLAGWQVADAEWTSRSAGLERFVSVQNRYSLLDRSARGRGRPGLRAVRRRRAAVLPARVRPADRQVPPRPGGTRRLAGEQRRPPPWLESADWDRIEALEAYAAARDLELIDVAIAGLAAQPAVSSVIAGATSGDQVRRNAAALRWEPTEADLVELDEITAGD